MLVTLPASDLVTVQLTRSGERKVGQVIPLKRPYFLFSVGDMVLCYKAVILWGTLHLILR